MSELDLDALEATAQAATPSEWHVEDSKFHDSYGHGLGQTFGIYWRSNVEYIAAFDPPTSLALIARLREAEQAMTELTKDEEVTVEGFIFRWSELPAVLARNMRAVTEAQQEAKRWAVQAKVDRARLREAEKALDGARWAAGVVGDVARESSGGLQDATARLHDAEDRLREAEAVIDAIDAIEPMWPRGMYGCPQDMIGRNQIRAVTSRYKTTKTEEEP